MNREKLVRALTELHDATLLRLEMDWSDGRALLVIRQQERRVLISLEDVSRVECPRERPWGPSVSINVARATAQGLEVEMQSGDTIRIAGTCSDIAFSEGRST